MVVALLANSQLWVGFHLPRRWFPPGGRPALTAFTTHGYCSPIHTDPADPEFTLGIRFDKPVPKFQPASGKPRPRAGVLKSF
jgi:hypothetical protein